MNTIVDDSPKTKKEKRGREILNEIFQSNKFNAILEISKQII